MTPDEVNKPEEFHIKIMKRRPKKNPKHYQIETLQDIADCVTSKNVNKFCREFKIVIHSILLMKELTEHAMKEQGLEYVGNEVRFPSMEWIDD